MGPDGKSTDFLSITSNRTLVGIKGLSDSYIYRILRDDNAFFDFNASCSESDQTEVLYSGKVSVNLPSNSKLKITVTRNGNTSTVIDTSSADVRRKFLPLQMDNDSNYSLMKNSSLYWWN